jgi:hypothetical protein
VVLLTVGFVVSGTPNGLGGVATDRYLVPLVIAAASVLPVLTASPIRARIVGAIGATVLVIPGLVTLATADMEVRLEAQPQAREATAIATWLTTHGADAGYSDYFTALALTYNTPLTVRTLEACRPPSAQVLCRGVINMRDAWYASDHRRRTFIILNAGTLVAKNQSGLGTGTVKVLGGVLDLFGNSVANTIQVFAGQVINSGLVGASISLGLGSLFLVGEVVRILLVCHRERLLKNTGRDKRRNKN